MTKTVIKTSKWKVNHQVRLSVVLLCTIVKLHLPLGLLKGKCEWTELIQGKRGLVWKIRNFKKSSLEKFRIPLYDKIVNSDVTNPFLDFLLNMLISLIKTCAYADGYIALLSVRLILFLWLFIYFLPVCCSLFCWNSFNQVRGNSLWSNFYPVFHSQS